jgi:uncharacterized membrane protein
MAIFPIIMIFFTLAVLIAGIFLMGKGGKLNKKYSNKLMIARVSFQFIVIIMLALMYFFVKK